jgi:hypothetical protein
VAFEPPELADRYRQALEPQLATLMHTGDGAQAADESPEQLEALRARGYAR